MLRNEKASEFQILKLLEILMLLHPVNIGKNFAINTKCDLHTINIMPLCGISRVRIGLNLTKRRMVSVLESKSF